MATILSPNAKFLGYKVSSGNLVPLPFGKLYTYAAGTNTPLATYTDSTGGSANPNPVILDANGMCDLWLGSAAYKFVLKDASDVTAWTVDNIDPAAYSNDALLAQAIACFAGELPPSNPVQGQLWYQPSVDTLWQYSGSSWSSVIKGTNLVAQTATAFNTAGTAPNFTMAPTTPLLAYNTNTRYRVKWSANATNPTVDISGLGAKNVKHYTSRGVKISSYVIGNVVDDMEYDGTDLVIHASYIPRNDGAIINYQASCTGTGQEITMTADRVTLISVEGSYIELTGVSLTVYPSTSGINGLDTGSLAGSTWYHKYIIYNPASNLRRTLCSLSATAPTLPSGYTHYRRMGAFRTDGTANKFALSMIWRGSTARYKVAAGSNLTALPEMASGSSGSITTPTWTAVALSAFIPPTAINADIYVRTPSGSSVVMAAPNDGYGAYNSATNPPPLVVVTGNHGANFAVEGSNFYYASNDSSGKMRCYGWEDAI